MAVTCSSSTVQQAAIIGFLGTDPATCNPWTAAFVKRLSELGWNEDRTVTIEHRWDEARPERDAEIASEFVRLKVDTILTNGIAAATLKRATQVIPIVFVLSPDPLGGGLVENLARPGGNIGDKMPQSTERYPVQTERSLSIGNGTASNFI